MSDEEALGLLCLPGRVLRKGYGFIRRGGHMDVVKSKVESLGTIPDYF